MCVNWLFYLKKKRSGIMRAFKGRNSKSTREYRVGIGTEEHSILSGIEI
jgi:hypothetical protein